MQPNKTSSLTTNTSVAAISTAEDLPHHNNVVVQLKKKMIPGLKNARGRFFGLLDAIIGSTIPKNHISILETIDEVAEHFGNKDKFSKAEMVSCRAARRWVKAQERIAAQKAAEKAKQPDGGTEVAGIGKLDIRPAAGNGHSSGLALEVALRENVLALSKISVPDKNVDDLDGPDPLDTGIMLMAVASMFTDPARMPMLAQPQAMADAISAAAEHIERLGAGYDPDIIGPAVENLCRQAAIRGGHTDVGTGDKVGVGDGCTPHAGDPPSVSALENEGEREAANAGALR